MNMRKTMIGLTATILATGAVLAFGAGIIGSTIASDKLSKSGDDSSRTILDENARTRSALPAKEIVTRLEEQGYTEVYEIEQERGVYEVKALHPTQGRVELYIDPGSGEVLKQEAHD